MDTLAVRSYREEFTRRAERKREELQRDVSQLRRDEREKEERQAAKEASELEAVTLTVLATAPEIAQFEVRLDAYDTATVDALMENEKALEKASEDLRIVREKAYVLADGRRVYKTEDGTRIFDEQGEEVKSVDPKEIEDWRPSWEQLTTADSEHQRLIDERQDLHDYQARLDAARVAAKDDTLTKGELAELKATLEKDMPDRVKAGLPAEFAPDCHDDAQAHRPVVNPSTSAKLDMPSI